MNFSLIKLNKNYNNPRFYPRKFKKWSDEFDINLNENNELVIRRSDVKVGGWGESLIIDVEFDDGGFLDFVNNQKIPKVIYQTFETDDVPSGMYDSINSWINKNTDYEHYFFNHESRLEFIEKHKPGRLDSFFDTDLFVYANVPYKIKDYKSVLNNPKDTIEFDEILDEKIRQERLELGADGALLRDENRFIVKVNFIENQM